MISQKKIQDFIPGYQINMGFGLHYGWGIEGAIGSNLKIDASYLSPNVNIASRLEAATRQYGVYVLVSNAFHQFLSHSTQRICRAIDIVTVKGSLQPLKLFTINCDIQNLIDDNIDFDETDQIAHKTQKELLTEIFDPETPEKPFSIINSDEHIQKLLNYLSNIEFTQKFSEGFELYIQGDWETSKQLLQTCLELNPNDGPTKVIYNFLNDSSFKCPNDWKGYRALTVK